MPHRFEPSVAEELELPMNGSHLLAAVPGVAKVVSPHQSRKNGVTSKSPVGRLTSQSDPTGIDIPMINIINASPMGQLSPSQNITDENFRSRTNSHGIRDFFRKLRRSGSNSRENGAMSGEASPPSSGAAVTLRSVERNENSGARHRSHSEASKLQRPKRRVTGELLSDEGKKHEGLEKPHAIGPLEFLEMYRERAYSDSRNDAARIQMLTNIRSRKIRMPSGGVGSCGVGVGVAGSPLHHPVLSPLCTTSDAKEPHLIIWCDPQTGTQVFRLPTISLDSNDDEGGGEKREGDANGKVGGVQNGSTSAQSHQVYTNLLKSCQCYDIIPSSSKVVLFDSELLAHAALYALLYNGIRSAPVWDSQQRTVIGMLTVTDFLRVLLYYYDRCPNDLKDIEHKTLASLRETIGFKVTSRRSAGCPLSCTAPSTTLLDAARCLKRTGVRRLPVIDQVTGDVLHNVTKFDILRVIQAAIRETSSLLPDFMKRSVADLGIGTFVDVVTVTLDTPLVDALRLLVDKRISGVPVVDESGKPVAMYTKATAMQLAIDQMYSVKDLLVGQVLTSNCAQFVTCRKDETLLEVFTRIMKTEVDCIIALDAEGFVEGTVTQSDILYHMVLNDDY